MRKLLLVIDMQNDFISGALGTPEAQAIVDRVAAEIEKYPVQDVIATRDTHSENYLETQEGRNLPVPHCIKDTPGWEQHPKIASALKHDVILRLQNIGRGIDPLCGSRRPGNYPGGPLYGYLCHLQCPSGESLSAGNAGPGTVRLLRGRYSRDAPSRPDHHADVSNSNPVSQKAHREAVSQCAFLIGKQACQRVREYRSHSIVTVVTISR